MELTPLDIHHKEFHRTLRGYNEEEVDVFLDQVADAFEHLFNENRELKEQTDKMKDKVLKYEGLEQTMQKAILTAQQAADEVQSNAAKESELIVKDAEFKAKEIIQDIDNQKRKVQEQLGALQGAEEDFRENFKSLLKEYLGTISKVEAGEIEIEEEDQEVAAEEVEAPREEVEAPREEVVAEADKSEPETEQVEVSTEEKRVEFKEETQLEKDVETAEEERESATQASEERIPATDSVSTEEIYQRETEMAEEDPTVFIPPPGSSDQSAERKESRSEYRPGEATKEAHEGAEKQQDDEQESRESASSVDESNDSDKKEKKVQDLENFFDNSSFFEGSSNDKNRDDDPGEKQHGHLVDDQMGSSGNEGPTGNNDLSSEPDNENGKGKSEDKDAPSNKIDYGFPEPGSEKPPGSTDDVSTFFDDNLGSE